MVSVHVTVAMGARTVSLDDVKDSRIATPLRATARSVGSTLSRTPCPLHGKTATNVRVHFDARGAADLKYDSCCEALGRAIGKALG